MFKLITKTFLIVIFALLFAGQVSAAASDVSIRLAQPKSPTNQNTLHITFVALDIQDRAITVKCFKKGPGDGSFAQFGGDISLAVGGNTGNCETDSSIIDTAGSYQFYATATAGSDTATSSTVNVDYNNSGPGAPTNFSKEKNTACTYKIKFRTADDSGKTIKVRIYRADATASDPSSTSEVGVVNIGSNTDGEFTDTIPDCNKTYYYAVRAFDSAGNASGTTGDSITIPGTVTTTTTTSGGTGTGGAIPVGSGQGQVLGEETTSGKTGKTEPTKSVEKKVLGTESEKPKTTIRKVQVNPVSQAATWVMTHKKISLAALLLIAIGATGAWFYRKSRNS